MNLGEKHPIELIARFLLLEDIKNQGKKQDWKYLLFEADIKELREMIGQSSDMLEISQEIINSKLDENKDR